MMLLWCRKVWHSAFEEVTSRHIWKVIFLFLCLGFSLRAHGLFDFILRNDFLMKLPLLFKWEMFPLDWMTQCESMTHIHYQHLILPKHRRHTVHLFSIVTVSSFNECVSVYIHSQPPCMKHTHTHVDDFLYVGVLKSVLQSICLLCEW